ncbi:hypothetical protein MRX96_048566 [Rhipicephalus microplus]
MASSGTHRRSAGCSRRYAAARPGDVDAKARHVAKRSALTPLRFAIVAFFDFRLPRVRVMFRSETNEKKKSETGGFRWRRSEETGLAHTPQGSSASRAGCHCAAEKLIFRYHPQLVLCRYNAAAPKGLRVDVLLSLQETEDVYRGGVLLSHASEAAIGAPCQ